MHPPNIHDLSRDERAQLNQAILEHGLDPDEFLAEVVQYAKPDGGATIRHVAIEVGRVRSLLWSEGSTTWLDRFREHLHAGLYDEDGAARSPDGWDRLELPFEVHFEQLDDAA